MTAPGATERVRTPLQMALRRFRRSRLAVAGLAVLAVLYTVMIFAGFVAPNGENHPYRDYSLVPPALTRLRFVRPDGHFSLRPWFVPYRFKRDPRTGDPRDVTCGPDGKDTMGQACTWNPQELTFLARTGAPEDDWHLLGLIPSSLHLVGTRPLLPNGHAEPVFLLGTDILGRDLFSRITLGSRISLTIGLVGIAISFGLGILIGAFSGYRGGWIDDAIQRLGEVFQSVPSLYLILAIQAVAIERLQAWYGKVLDARIVYLLIISILAFVGWAGTARVVRGLVLSLRELDYVTASRALGASDLRIMIRHLLPNTTTFLIIQATLSIPYYILSEVVLSFLGVGIREPAASWGTMLTAARQTNILLHAPWLLLPGAAIFVTVMAYNMLGDGLRDALDPRHQLR